MKLLYTDIGPYGPYDIYLHQASVLMKIGSQWLILGSLPPPDVKHSAYRINMDTGKPFWITGVMLPTEMESWLDICTVSQTLFKDRSEMHAVRSYPPVHQVD